MITWYLELLPVALFAFLDWLGLVIKFTMRMDAEEAANSEYQLQCSASTARVHLRSSRKAGKHRF